MGAAICCRVAKKLRKDRRKQTLDFTVGRPKSQAKAGKNRVFHAFFSPFLAGFAWFDAGGKCAEEVEHAIHHGAAERQDDQGRRWLRAGRNSACCLQH
ncbi:hypothetical protein [Herbaspirillum sp. 3R-3a1]|uniref:hypothetical protein n=1 Tax=Herbaspirillum sp. 3R-3a1 TaxID=2293566 RepID=UPI001313D9F4|nr:hypothetical protein [Herbaspirillum sp. 3R-3a1]